MEELQLANALANCNNNEEFYTLCLFNIPQFLSASEFFMKYTQFFMEYAKYSNTTHLQHINTAKKRYGVEKQMWKKQIQADKYITEILPLTKRVKTKAYA